MEEVQTALCGSAHLMLLVQQMCSLEIRALFLQFAVVHVNCEKLRIQTNLSTGTKANMSLMANPSEINLLSRLLKTLCYF